MNQSDGHICQYPNLSIHTFSKIRTWGQQDGSVLEALAAKPNYLSLVPRIDKMEGEKLLPKVAVPVCNAHTHRDMHTRRGEGAEKGELKCKSK